MFIFVFVCLSNGRVDDDDSRFDTGWIFKVLRMSMATSWNTRMISGYVGNVIWILGWNESGFLMFDIVRYVRSNECRCNLVF